MKAVIIGANGQDGYYLNQLLSDRNIEVTGVSRSGNFLHTDITNYKAVKELISSKPDYVFHLAANSTTAHHALFDNHAAISTGTINLLEAVKAQSPGTKVFLSGSGLQFENNNKPIKESDPFHASSPYSVARIHSVYAARYFQSLGLKVYVGYFFNHESPRRTERHVSKMIGEAVKRISKGSKERIIIGDISVKKEWTFAGDIAEAICFLIGQENVFETVIGSGQGYTIQDYLYECFSLIHKNWEDFVDSKSDFKAEYKQLVSDPITLFNLGWQPKHSFHDLAKMMIEV